MKLRFEPDLDFQWQAVEAVCDLFRGQEVCRTEFTVTNASTDRQHALALGSNELGVGNRLTLLDDEILENLKGIQLRNGLAACRTWPCDVERPREGCLLPCGADRRAFRAGRASCHVRGGRREDVGWGVPPGVGAAAEVGQRRAFTPSS